MTAVMHRQVDRARLGIQPIDDAARDGSYRLVFTRARFALVRWNGEAWVFPGGRPLPIEPEGYRP